MQDYLVLGLGVISAAAGGELFVRGAVGIARHARVSGAIIGATVAAFATSSPELAVAISSAAAAKPQIALGDALGSSIVNVALILGLVLVISPVQCPRGTVVRDFPVALAVPVVTALLCLDGTLSRLDGALLLGFFALWIAAVYRAARRQREEAEAEAEAVNSSLWSALARAVPGLLLLFGAGELIVTGARGIAGSYGISEFAIGATVVAVGTSIPELATALIAKWRGHDDVGLGTVLGSNIFNGLWIVPVAAIIHPIDIEWWKVAAATAMGVLAMIVVFPPRGGLIGRGRGMLLLLVYGLYIAAISAAESG